MSLLPTSKLVIRSKYTCMTGECTVEFDKMPPLHEMPNFGYKLLHDHLKSEHNMLKDVTLETFVQLQLIDAYFVETPYIPSTETTEKELSEPPIKKIKEDVKPALNKLMYDAQEFKITPNVDNKNIDKTYEDLLQPFENVVRVESYEIVFDSTGMINLEDDEEDEFPEQFLVLDNELDEELKV